MTNPTKFGLRELRESNYYWFVDSGATRHASYNGILRSHPTLIEERTVNYDNQDISTTCGEESIHLNMSYHKRNKITYKEDKRMCYYSYKKPHTKRDNRKFKADNGKR